MMEVNSFHWKKSMFPNLFDSTRTSICGLHIQYIQEVEKGDNHFFLSSTIVCQTGTHLRDRLR